MLALHYRFFETTGRGCLVFWSVRDTKLINRTRGFYIEAFETRREFHPLSFKTVLTGSRWGRQQVWNWLRGTLPIDNF